MTEISNELIQRAIAGNQDAITKLYETTYSAVYKTVRALIRDEDTVLDIVQDSYIKGFQSLEQLDTPEHYQAWMKRIAVNKAKDYLKKKSPVLFSELSDTENEEVEFINDRPDHCPDQVLDQKETARLMNEILNTLSDEQRIVIGMFYYEELSVREIAEILDCSENTVKSRLNYGRKKIEVKVRELEKNGTKLYSLAPLPFLLWLFRQDAQAAEIPSVEIWNTISRSFSSSASTTAKIAAGAVSKGVGAKVVTGILIASIAGGSAAGIFYYQSRSNNSVREAVSEEDIVEETVLSEAELQEVMLEEVEPEEVEPEEADTEPDALTNPQESSFAEVDEETDEEIPQETDFEDLSVKSFEEILKRLEEASLVPLSDFEADPGYYHSFYRDLGEGVIDQLLYRDDGVHTLDFFCREYDIDHDGEDELLFGRSVSPSWVTPIAIYKIGEHAIVGQGLMDYEFPNDADSDYPQWNLAF